MFPEILLSVLAGTAFGTITGLVPGIHPNTVFVVLVSLAFSGALALSGSPLLFFIVAVAVSNTFTDFIPSIAFGAPDPSSALSVLPGHRLLMAGQGHAAVCLTVVGGLGVASLVLLTLPILVYALPPLYLATRPVIHWLLISVVILMLARERGRARLAGAWVFLSSGLMGFIVLGAYPAGTMLFPSLTGLFGISGLVFSLGTGVSVPRQEPAHEFSCDARRGIFLGWVSGWFAGMLPGIGAAQAGVISGEALRAKPREFLVALGGVNTSNILFTLAVFFLVGKTRSGAVWALSQLTSPTGVWLLAALMVAGLFCCFVSGLLTISLARYVLGLMNRFPYSSVSLLVVASLLVLSLAFAGLPGIIAACTGSLIGLFCIRMGASRSHMMGFLILPTFLHFSGLSPVASLTLGM